MRVAVKFARNEHAKFVSHLDMQRSVMRLLARTNLPLEYSEGFNPHIILSFAYPMPVGLISEGEFFEFRLRTRTPLNEILAKLKEHAPSGIIPKLVGELPIDAPKLMSAVSLAGYKLSGSTDDLEKIEVFVKNAKEILVTNKKGKTRDAKPMIAHMESEVDSLRTIVSFGSEGTLNPADLILSLKEKLNLGDIEIIRLGLYTKTANRICTLDTLCSVQIRI